MVTSVSIVRKGIGSVYTEKHLNMICANRADTCSGSSKGEHSTKCTWHKWWHQVLLPVEYKQSHTNEKCNQASCVTTAISMYYSNLILNWKSKNVPVNIYLVVLSSRTLILNHKGDVSILCLCVRVFLYYLNIECMYGERWMLMLSTFPKTF